VDHSKEQAISFNTPTNKRFAGQGGRPRTFHDEAIFQATTKVIAELGYARCSMEAVASDLGCSGQALTRRFGSKRGLIEVYLDWVLERSAEWFRSSRRDHHSPLEALRARCEIPAEDRPEEIGDPVDANHRANTATFWAAVRCDPVLREKAQASVRATEREIVETLDEAIVAGELEACDTLALGRTLLAAWVGANQLWSGTEPSETLVERLMNVFDQVIDPHRVPKTTSER
jgi:AcrR family transcriptional regulator